MDGLGLLPLTTVFAGTKETHRIRGEVLGDTGLLTGAKGSSIAGYEIHMGRTTPSGGGDQRAAGLAASFRINDRSDVAVTGDTELDGVIDPSGRVLGTYIHGLFQNGGLRQAVLRELARRKGVSLPLVVPRPVHRPGVRQAGRLGTGQPADGLGLPDDRAGTGL